MALAPQYPTKTEPWWTMWVPPGRTTLSLEQHAAMMDTELSAEA